MSKDAFYGLGGNDAISVARRSRNDSKQGVGTESWKIDYELPLKSTPFKYNEDKYIEEALEHIKNTYSQHYVANDGIQFMDIVMSADDSFGFLKYNAGKYMMRYGKKEGYNKKDIMKAIHFLVLALHKIDLQGEIKE